MSGRYLPPMPAVRDIIHMYKLSARKQLSQNFLLDLNVTDRIVKCAGDISGYHVCEVGPGPGSITRSILKANASRITVIEKDRRFFPALQYINQALGDNLIEIYQGDVLKFNMSNIFTPDLITSWTSDIVPQISIIGNLPFNISTPLIFKWISQISRREGAWRYGRVPMTLTFQHEVAERMVAPIMNKQRSRMSIIAQNWCDVSYDYLISGRAFVPAPDVNVGVLTFRPKVHPEVDVPYQYLCKLTNHIFHYRQKYSHKGACTLFPKDRPELTVRLFYEAGVPARHRPTELSVEEYGRLALVYKEICDENPDIFNFNYRSKENAAQWKRTKVKVVGL